MVKTLYKYGKGQQTASHIFIKKTDYFGNFEKQEMGYNFAI